MIGNEKYGSDLAMARYWCQRCGEESNTLDEPHLCKDLKKRYERNAKAIAIVVDILTPELHSRITKDEVEAMAAEIIKALSGRDLGVD
jgi:transposase-like protein